MKGFLVILVMVFLMALWTQAIFGAQELTLGVPPGWVSVEPQFPEQKLYALLPDEQGQARAELIFATEPVASNLDLQGYFQQASQFLQTSFQNYTPQETTSFTVSGLSGLRHKFLFQLQDNPKTFQGLAFFFLLEGRAYVLLFDCSANEFPQLESQFQQIAQGLTLTSGTTTATPSSPPTLPPAGPPDIGTAEEPSYWIYQNPQNTFRVPLPQGASLSQDLDNGAVYTTPNQGQLVILALPGETQLQGIVAQVVQGKNFHGTSQINTASGDSFQVALYSSRNPDTGIEYATIVGTLSGKNLLILVVLPVVEYEPAKGWIEKLLVQTEVR